MSEVMYELKGPAPEDAVLRLRGQYPNLPADYYSFLLRSDGGEGFVGVSPGYFALWSAHEVAHFSSEYQVHIYLPGYVAVGSSGGGDLYIFPVSGWPPGLFLVPAIGMDLDCVQFVSRSFSAFVAEFGKQWLTPA
jgi:hypothetical protein